MSQVRKKRRIVIASLLKPVDDTRMFEKLALSLQAMDYEVHIIGFPSSTPTSHPAIQFHSLGYFKRTGFSRLLQTWKVLQVIHQVKPERVIVNTPELLWVAIVNRIFFGRKIYYDVLENYSRNIRYTRVYSPLFRPLLASMVRLVEWCSKPFLHHFFLAESAYAHELPFAAPYLVLQNKLPRVIAQQYPRKRNLDYKHFIFTGTLAESTGVFEAIDLVNQLNSIDPQITLTIVGYTPVSKTLLEIEQKIKPYPHIRLVGGNELVPHHQILESIQQADAGIIIYPKNPSTQGSIPTKLYEYLALGLPILIQHVETAHQLVKKYQAGLVLPELSDPNNLLSALIRLQPYQPDDDVYWERDAKQLLKVLIETK